MLPSVIVQAGHMACQSCEVLVEPVQGVARGSKNSLAMAEAAYLLIALDRNTPAAVAGQIRKIPGVVDAHITMGEFDVVALVEQAETKGFPGVAAAVQRVEGVSKVVTCVVVRP